jgi:hypothetical protein
MAHYFDELVKAAGGDMPRRQALWRMGSILAGAAVGALTFTGRAAADTLVACNQQCKRFPGLRDFLTCRTVCMTCPSASMMCGSSSANLVCCNTANAGGGCVSNSCNLVCNNGFQNCNNNPADGCETNVNTDVNNCGTCNHMCAIPNGTAGCSNGACFIIACNAGFADCNNNPGDGCETNLNTSVANCGMCTHSCLALPNVANAGCTNGACFIIACNAGFADCNNNSGDGCETDLNTSVANCGMCGHNCNSLPNVASAGCTNGACVVTGCLAGFADCNNNPNDGCETNLNTSVANCGMCTHSCLALPNVAGATCNAGICVVTSCNAGFGDCNGNPNDGCETNLNNTFAHCGSCNHSCQAGQTCSNGNCV